jgi:cell division control protein 6
MPKLKQKQQEQTDKHYLTHREEEQQTIEESFKSMIGNQETIDLLCTGPSGTGKTATVKQAAEQVKQEKPINICYVDCFSQKTRFEVLYQLLDKKVELPRDGVSTEKVVEELAKKARKRPTVLIVDNADKELNDETLFDLARFRSSTVVLIANQENFLSDFSDQVRSRLSGTQKVEFQRYTEQQLVDLMKEQPGYSHTEISEQDLHRIAEKSGGDARIALNSLKKLQHEIKTSTQDSTEEDLHSVLKDLESEVAEKLNEEEWEKLDLNKDQKLIYKILKDADGDLPSGELYERYRNKVESPRTKRTVRRYIGSLVDADLVEKQGVKSGTTYRAP